jgi:hypothetical protein
LPNGIMSVILSLVRAPRDWKEAIDPEPIVPCMAEVKVLCTPWEGVDLRSAVIDAKEPADIAALRHLGASVIEQMGRAISCGHP